MKTFEKRIEAILKRFDFERIVIVMTALDWKWGYMGPEGVTRVPTAEEMKETGKRLLTSLFEETDFEGQIQSGGFRAIKMGIGNNYTLELIFVPEKASSPSWI